MIRIASATKKKQISFETAAPTQDRLDALSEDCRLLLARLAVFRGGWTLAMAAEVLGGVPSPVLLRELQTADLICPLPNFDPPRWNSPAAVLNAAFALLSPRERRRLSAAHARSVVALSIAARKELFPLHASAYLARIEAEHGNIEAVIQWALREGRSPALGARLLPLLHTYCHETNRRALLRVWLELALTHRKRLSDAAIYGLCYALGYACLGDYDHEAAFAAFQDATRYAATLGKVGAVAAAFDALGVAAHHATQDAQARAAFEAGLAAAPDTEEFDSERGFLLSNYAVALAVQNEPTQARALLEQSLTLAERAQNSELRAMDYERLAELLMTQGELAQAQEYANRSLELWQAEPEARRRETGECLRLLGEIHLEQGHGAEARHLLWESAAIFAALGKAQCRAAALGLLGDVEFQQGRLAAALAFYEEGYAVWEQAAHPRWQAIFLLRIAEVVWHQGDGPRTAALCDAALTHCDTAHNEKTRAAVLRLQAQILLQSGDFSAAETKANDSLTLFRRLGRRRGAESALETLAQIALQSGVRV